MKRIVFILTLAVAVLLGFAIAIGSTIGQGFISVGALAASAYATIQQAGSALTQRTILNFVSGATCVDNSGAGSTDCTITASGGGGFIQSLTAPVAANFTAENYNVGSGVTTTQTNNSSPVTSITLQQSDPGGTGNIVALAKNKIAATFTISAAFSMSGDVDAEPLAGIWLSDGGSPPNNLFICYHASQLILRIPIFTNFTTFSTDAYNSSASPYPLGPLVWFRIQETASARNYYVGNDGITWNQIFTESNTAHFVTSMYGFGEEIRAPHAGGGQTGVTLYSFTETNP